MLLEIPVLKEQHSNIKRGTDKYSTSPLVLFEQG